MSKKKPRRVALVGTAPSQVQAPFDDLSVEIWGTGSPSPHIKRATRWFDVHRHAGFSDSWQAAWREVMQNHKDLIPELWMFHPREGLGPKVVQYPIQRIMSRFGRFFLTSSFAWMAALAIDEMRPLGKNGLVVPKKNDDEIMIYGADMEYGGEWHEQRHGIRHFFRVAGEAGIKVTRLTTSGLAYEPIPYPWWDDDPMLNKIRHRKQHYEERGQGMKDLLSKLESAVVHQKGARDALQRLLPAATKKTQQEIRERIEKTDQAIASLEGQMAEPREMLLRLEGCLQEADWYEHYIAP